MSDSVRPHRLHPAMLLCPWDSPGKNTGVGCHFLLHVYHQRTITRSWNSIGTPVEEFLLLRLDHALAHSGSFSSPPGLSRAACTVRHTLQGELSLECDDGRRNRFLKLYSQQSQGKTCSVFRSQGPVQLPSVCSCAEFLPVL